MTETISDFLLTQLIANGAPIFALALLIGAIGVPLPGTVLVVAAGAFVRQGALDGFSSASLGLIGAVIGDSISFSMGRAARASVQNRFGASPIWNQARSAFERGGQSAVYFSRFLFTAIAIPVNLMAGESDCPYYRFLIFSILGEATWIVGYGGLGWLFGSEWELISDFLSEFGGMALGAVILGAGMYFMLRNRQRAGSSGQKEAVSA